MTVVKSVLKLMVASTLIVTGVVVAGTVLAAKGIDKAGDDLQDKIVE
ncbi:MAG: hypothetical protein ACTIAG_04635 [Lactobacillus sp.]|nr:hypothetical protein [Lactobacillus sp.]MDN6043500.1 hypothetical protein [Lactobacillus sp.]MDN6053156.1 hypothetical protein [Lactobacillus sp.]